MKLIETEDFKYFESLEDCKPEYTPIKVWSVVQFFKLSGKKTVIIAENLIPIPDLKYCYFAPNEKKYYLRDFNYISINDLYKNEDEDDLSVLNLRRRISDGNVWLLITKEQVADTYVMLQRLWKANRTGEGRLDYKTWIKLAKLSLDLEDYKIYGKNLTGYLTVCNQYENQIRELWKNAPNNLKKEA